MSHVWEAGPWVGIGLTVLGLSITASTAIFVAFLRYRQVNSNCPSPKYVLREVFEEVVNGIRDDIGRLEDGQKGIASTLSELNIFLREQKK